jgi:DNA-binding CsgD family transcriptional regulator
MRSDADRDVLGKSRNLLLSPTLDRRKTAFGVSARCVDSQPAPAEDSPLATTVVGEVDSLNSPTYATPLTEPSRAPRRALLLEREFALEAIADAVARAAVGEGTAVIVHGRAGLGKSHLLASAKNLAQEKGLRVLSAAGLVLEMEFDFGVVLQLFDPAVQCASDEERRELMAGPARDAGVVISPGKRFGRRPAKDSFRTLRGLYWLAANLAERMPLMVVVDDADLADVKSLRFLLYLLEHLESLPVVALLSRGAGIRAADSDLVRQLTHHPAASHLGLEPLSEAATTQVVRCFFPDAGEKACRAAYEATRGNPWLMEALCEDAGQASPTTANIAIAAPRSVADRILHRISTLGGGAAMVISAAAILEDDAELRHVAHLAGLDPSDAGVLVDELIAVGVLEHDDGIAFSEPLLRRAVEATLPPARRAELHYRTAELLAADGASPARLGEHLLRTLPAANEWVVEQLCRAAADAMAQAAPGLAVSYLRRALDEPPPPDRRARVSSALGRAEATAGEPQAVSHLQAAMADTRDRRERAEICFDTGRALAGFGRQADAAEAFERGLQDLDDAEDDLFGRLSAGREATRLLWGVRDGRRPEPRPETLLTESAVENRAVLAQLAFEAALRGDSRQQVIDLATRALDHGALLGEDTADGLAYYLACDALSVAEELGFAEVALTAAVREGATRGSVLGTATARFFRGIAFLRRGGVREAAADARHALDAERHGWHFASSVARSLLAEALFEAGSRREAHRFLAAAEAATGDSVWARVAALATRTHLLGIRENPQDALTGFLECGRLLEHARAPNPAVLSWRSGAARALAALGDRDEARELVRQELALAEVFGAPGVVGRSLRALGAIEGGNRGLEALEAAVAHLEHSPAALERARALVDYGAALRRSGRRRASREPLLRGMDLGRRFGSETLARRAAAEVKAAGARPRRTALKGRQALTPREEQVAALASQGSSNRAIAAELVVTQKTVEWHLKHVFDKLGLTSRGELPEALNGDRGLS